MFRDAKVGDRVWSIEFGWGTIDYIKLGPRIDEMHPGSGPHEAIHILFDKYGDQPFDYHTTGRRTSRVAQTLFWDEVKIVPPPKPKRKTTKIIEGWVYLLRGKDCGDIYISNFYDEKPKKNTPIAVKSVRDKIIGEPIFIRHEYEVEE